MIRAWSSVVLAFACAAIARAQCGMRADASLEGAAAWIAGGDHLWVNWTGELGIRGYTLAPDGAPTEACWVPTGPSPSSCIERGTLLYVAAQASLQVFDLSAEPRQLASIDLGGQTRQLSDRQVIEADGDRLAVNTGSTVVLFDLASPREPRLIDRIHGGPWEGLSLSGDLLALSSLSSPLSLFDVSDPAGARLLGQSPYELRAFHGQLIAQGSKVTILSSNLGLVVIDAADPSSPHLYPDTACVGYRSPARVSRVGPRFACGGAGVFSLDDQDVPLATLPRATGVPSIRGAALMPRHAAFLSSRIDICRTDVPHPPVFSRIHVRSPSFAGWAGVAEAAIVPEEGVSYQWYVGASPIPGATAPRLVIDSLPWAPLGWHVSCTATNACGSARGSDAVFFTGCPSDYNLDGRRSTQADYDAYVADFEAGDLKADANGDGFIDFFDYDLFVGAFTAPC